MALATTYDVQDLKQSIYKRRTLHPASAIEFMRTRGVDHDDAATALLAAVSTNGMVKVGSVLVKPHMVSPDPWAGNGYR